MQFIFADRIMFVLTLAVSGSQGVCNKRQEKQSSTCYDKMLPVPLDSLDCLHSATFDSTNYASSHLESDCWPNSNIISENKASLKCRVQMFERSDLVLHADTLALRHGVVLSML